MRVYMTMSRCRYGIGRQIAASRRTISDSLAWVFSSRNPYTTCHALRVEVRAQRI